MLALIRDRLTYANVMATIAVFIALGGTATAALIITDNKQVAKNTISGHEPPRGDRANMIANSVTGKDVVESSLTGNARKLIYTAAAAPDPAPLTTIATVGPYKIKGQCVAGAGGTFVKGILLANGPAGTVNQFAITTRDDATDLGTQSRGTTLSANTDEALDLGGAATPGHFQREAGTVMLQSGSTLVQVDFEMVADFRSAPGSCLIYGTATDAT